MQYKRGFYISKPLGNNVFGYEQRKKTNQHLIYVPSLKSGEKKDIKIGNKKVFKEIDRNFQINDFYGLRNFIWIKGTNIVVFDNHNHALYFWYKYIVDNNLDKNQTLIHIDQHSDMNENDYDINIFKEKDLDYIRDFAVYRCNVGNFIKPAIKSGLVGNVYQVITEYSLDNIKNNAESDFILDIDLDFRAKDLDHIDYEKKINIVKSLIKKSGFVTIATSPFFIDQNKALRVLNDLLD